MEGSYGVHGLGAQSAGSREAVSGAIEKAPPRSSRRLPRKDGRAEPSPGRCNKGDRQLSWKFERPTTAFNKTRRAKATAEDREPRNLPSPEERSEGKEGGSKGKTR